MHWWHCRGRSVSVYDPTTDGSLEKKYNENVVPKPWWLKEAIHLATTPKVSFKNVDGRELGFEDQSFGATAISLCLRSIGIFAANQSI